MNYIIKFILKIFIFFCSASSVAHAGPLGTLDSSSRKAVREAEMQSFQLDGATNAPTGSISELDTTSRRMVRESEMNVFNSTNPPTATNEKNINPGLLIQNTVDSKGQKKCIVSAGKVITGEIRRGSSVENRTVVTGNIVNVCQ